MPQTHKRWQISPRISPEIEAELRGYPPILRQILFNRGYATHEEARQFLQAKPPQNSDPFILTGMPQAVSRIQLAIQNKELIAVYGDYDVDGVTATTLLVSFLKDIEAEVIPYIPNRFNEGYGLNIEALEQLKDQGVSLVITVDCGIRSLDEADHARNLGLDLIITDHHHPGSQLPSAHAVIDPKQVDDLYPEKELAGVGLAYKLACALATFNEGVNADGYLDLVALGTVADLAPLVGENRALVRLGLKSIRQPVRQGVLSLIGVAGLKAENISATDIGFALGPRLNAAGRLDSALAALELLLTKDYRVAGKIAQELEVQNRERQMLTRAIQAKAEELALADDGASLSAKPFLLFAVDPEFNAGVVGLAASRLTDQYYRPAVVGEVSEEFTRASCRSISEFHITEALDQCADLLEQYGGHAAAAGFTVRNENVPQLKERLRGLAHEALSNVDLRPSLNIDIEVPLADLTPELLKHLSWLQPTGYGNRQPLFASRDLRVTHSRTVGRDSSHLKLSVSDGHLTFDAIAFRLGYWQGNLPPRIDLAYNFEMNEFNGRKTLQLNVRDIKPSGESD